MRLLITATLLSLGLWGASFDEAVEAYNKGAYIKALDAFYTLAKEGNVKAQYNVAMIYENGKGLKANRKEAMYWYEKAAKQENAEAQYNLAQIYHELGKENPHDYEKAKYWYEKAISHDIKQAYNNLASLYLEGKGVAKDEDKAFELFQKAAALNDAAGQFNVALLYAWGEKIKHDKMKAYENLKKALNAGKSEASEYLDKLCDESAWVCKD